jgi:hypothetical protein
MAVIGMQMIPLTLQCSKVTSSWADKFQKCSGMCSGFWWKEGQFIGETSNIDIWEVTWLRKRNKKSWEELISYFP